jgi:Arc/MetJ-type ribon-helix-helix transcriptional regulator
MARSVQKDETEFINLGIHVDSKMKRYGCPIYHDLTAMEPWKPPATPSHPCSTMAAMSDAKTVSVTLPPDLLLKAQEIAEREHRTISELVREAVRRYITPTQTAETQEWSTLLERTRTQGRSLGVATEADVERLSDEYRQEKRGTHG